MAPAWLLSLTAPSAPHLSGRASDFASSDSSSVVDTMAAQWQNPADILSILLLLGPDVVQRAIAQLAGRAITPVAFSYGWVAYIVSALLASFGDGRLMPESEVSISVIDAGSGHGRDTRNWVLSRLLRDFNNRLDNEMKNEQPHISLSSRGRMGEDKVDVDVDVGNVDFRGRAKGKGKAFEALRVTVFEVDDDPLIEHGVPALDWVWYSGIAVIAVQLGISAVPWAVNGQWNVFLVTAAGNLFAVVGGSLPQWRSEKWACPKKGGDTAIITEGNGSRSAIVIKGKKGVGLKIEVMARGTRTVLAKQGTKMSILVLAMLWILLLVSVAGMKQNTWYLLGIGLLGSIQNLVAAGVQRSPAALGIHIKQVDVIHAPSVSETLRKVEEKYPLVGTALLNVFFPGSMRISREKTEEVSFWCSALDARYGDNKHGTRLERLVPRPREN